MEKGLKALHEGDCGRETLICQPNVHNSLNFNSQSRDECESKARLESVSKCIRIKIASVRKQSMEKVLPPSVRNDVGCKLEFAKQGENFGGLFIDGRNNGQKRGNSISIPGFHSIRGNVN